MPLKDVKLLAASCVGAAMGS